MYIKKGFTPDPTLKAFHARFNVIEGRLFLLKGMRRDSAHKKPHIVIHA